MILVDTSVWVDFFRGQDRAADLAEHLESNLVLLHPSRGRKRARTSVDPESPPASGDTES